MKACLLPSIAVAAGLAAGAAHADTLLGGRPLDGVVTLVGLYGPDYLGSRDSGTSLRPGLFLRWGRVSISSGAGWAARRQEVERRGLGIELSHSDAFDLSLGLRSDSGRDEDSSPALTGMGDVKRTLRVRLGATWRFAPQWQVSTAWTADALGRGGGYLVDTKLQRQWQLAPGVLLESGAQVTFGSSRYMQAYYGVNDEQAARSGYRAYQPGAGFRDLSGYASLKAELGDNWVAMAGPGFNYMLAPAADSPLTQRRLSWTFSAGLGWRF